MYNTDRSVSLYHGAGALSNQPVGMVLPRDMTAKGDLWHCTA